MIACIASPEAAVGAGIENSCELLDVWRFRVKHAASGGRVTNFGGSTPIPTPSVGDYQNPLRFTSDHNLGGSNHLQHQSTRTMFRLTRNRPFLSALNPIRVCFILFHAFLII